MHFQCLRLQLTGFPTCRRLLQSSSPSLSVRDCRHLAYSWSTRFCRMKCALFTIEEKRHAKEGLT